MKKYAVITVLDNLSETSMPWNEFVLYRYKHDKDLKQYIIVCNSNVKSSGVPSDLDITFVGFNSKKIRKTMKRIVDECVKQQMDYVIHLHQNKSAAYFNISTIFMGYARKTLFTVHSQFTAYNFQNKVASLFNTFRAKQVTNVSATSYAVYPAFLKKIKGQRMTYIANGVDIERIDKITNSRTKNRHDTKRFVYVARMIPLKKHDFLIDVFHDIKDNYELVLIGAEDTAGTIRSKVDEYRMTDKVIMTGLIPRDELFAKLVDADVYVSSSTIEGLPISVLEAMAVGLPAVISDIEPHKEIQRVCDVIETLPFDKQVWVEKITQIINTNSQELSERGVKCRAAVIAEFSLQNMHKKYYNEYAKLMK